MVMIPKFTPELLISTPLRGPAVPNHDGTLALFSQSTHEPGGKTTKEYRVLSIHTGESKHLISEEKARDVHWIGDGTNTIIYLSHGSNGYTWIKTVDADSDSAEPLVIDFVEAPVQHLKLKALKDGSIAFVVAGLADAEHHLYNEESDRRLHTARVTESCSPRLWNSYSKPQSHVLWYTNLVKEDGSWKINKPLRNGLRGTNLTTPLALGGPEDATDEFDVSQEGIIFAATEKNVSDPRRSLLSNIWHLAVQSFCEDSAQGPSKILLQTEIHPQSTNDQGYCSRPVFSPDGSMIAFLRSSYERPLDKSIWLKHADSRSAIDVSLMITGRPCSLLPHGFSFAPDGHALYIQAPNSGRTSLYRLDLLPNAEPRLLSRKGSVSAYHTLRQEDDNFGKLLVTGSSFVEPWFYQVIDTSLSSEPTPPCDVSRASQHIALGLSQKQVSEIYFEGVGDYFVQAWVIKPRDFDPGKKRYPLCLLVHDGPNGHWKDAWDTQWNHAAWAEQGYVVVAPNITGSQGFGLNMAEAIQDNWGGHPYDDLVNCLENVKDMPGIDMDNAVAAGSGYGGYMMNWIQGHELGRRSLTTIFRLHQTNTLPDLLHEFGGTPFLWNNFDGLERYNPARPDLLKNWKTPMLVAHSDGDFGRPVTEGLGAYHTLKALGTPARFLSFADEGQVLVRGENLLEWYRQVFAWVNKWSGVAARGSGSRAGSRASSLFS
ncbi:hypothetical protein G7054_g5169 [Neopestalotiopsis clavispora]|nr:hypothetical protein G7054_g5169 [Neopestalotiopsis clavispora]